MKRITIILLMMLLALAMSVVFVNAAADSHGADAHSPSMSIQSGEDPIPDKSTTMEAGGGDIVDYADDEEDEDDSFDKKDMEQLARKVVPLDLALNEELLEDNQGISPYYYAAGGLGVIVVIGLLIGIRRASSKKNKDKYRGKH